MEDRQNTTIEREKRVLFKRNILLSLISLLIIALLIVIVILSSKKDVVRNADPIVMTEMILDRISNISDLSTYTAVYNGVAEVQNEENPKNIDYYVSYEARVDAGIDFEKINLRFDEETSTLYMDIPEITTTNITVDIASLDYIFVNKSANTSSITREAYAACENDAESESRVQNKIYDMARQNAINVLTALVSPIIEQFDSQCKLVVQ